jgi:hypothetical protein
MQIAGLCDIHANLPALDAVIAEIKDVDVILIGGDVVWGPWCADRLTDAQLEFVRPGPIEHSVRYADRI